MLREGRFLAGRSRRDRRVRHPCLSAVSLRPPVQAGGLPDFSQWLTERGSAQMASPQAMARRDGHDRVPALAGGHGHNEALRVTPPESNIKVNASRRDARDAYHMFLASLRDAVILCWVPVVSVALRPQPPAKFWQASGLPWRDRPAKKSPGCVTSVII
jgi:hypothetical protein